MKKMLLLANFLALSIAEIKKITIKNSAKEQFVVFENAESIGNYKCVFYMTLVTAILLRFLGLNRDAVSR